MFTKTLSALAIILSTVSSAVAVTKHEGTAANHEPAIKSYRQNPRDKADFVIGNMLFVGFHEMGHALADQFRPPTLGRAAHLADKVFGNIHRRQLSKVLRTCRSNGRHSRFCPREDSVNPAWHRRT
jgi:hypothetical protein